MSWAIVINHVIVVVIEIKVRDPCNPRHHRRRRLAVFVILLHTQPEQEQEQHSLCYVCTQRGTNKSHYYNLVNVIERRVNLLLLWCCWRIDAHGESHASRIKTVGFFTSLLYVCPLLHLFSLLFLVLSYTLVELDFFLLLKLVKTQFDGELDDMTRDSQTQKKEITAGQYCWARQVASVWNGWNSRHGRRRHGKTKRTHTHTQHSVRSIYSR